MIFSLSKYDLEANDASRPDFTMQEEKFPLSGCPGS
jgi:hypothetical protein